MGRLTKLLNFVRLVKNGANVSQATLDPGGGNNITAEHFEGVGDDSRPLKGDYVFTNSIQTTGGQAISGYLDPKNKSKSSPGEKRLYSRDEETGEQVTEVWLKNDGSLHLSNDNASIVINTDGDISLQTVSNVSVKTENSNFDVESDGLIRASNSSGSYELQSSGNFVVNGLVIDTSGKINGVTIDGSGNISGPGSITADSVQATTSLVGSGKDMVDHTHPAGSPPGNTGANN